MAFNSFLGNSPLASASARRVLGIDPGTQLCGFGIVEDQGQQLRCLACGTIKTMTSRDNDEGSNLPQRLLVIYDNLTQLIKKYQPKVMAVESVFHAANAQSALKLGHARGVILMTAAQHGLDVFEYAPRSIKKGLTGSGAASKEQVQKMVKMLLRGTLDEATSRSLDATDALAAAIFHSHNNPFLKSVKSAVRAAEGLS